MKTFIVYDLDSQMPVAVGEQISGDCAILCKRDNRNFPSKPFARRNRLRKTNYLLNQILEVPMWVNSNRVRTSAMALVERSDFLIRAPIQHVGTA
jgi:hypothetical protein